MLIDNEILLKNKLTPNELYILYYIFIKRFKTVEEVFSRIDKKYFDETFSYLQEQGFIKLLPNNQVSLRQKTIDIFKENINEGEFIKKYRNLFDKSNINGIIGKKGDKQSCIKKMHLFMKQYPQYNEDIILKAAQLYIQSESKNNNFKYLQRADYVISKQEAQGKIVGSRLATFCEEVVEGAEPEDTSTDIFTINV